MMIYKVQHIFLFDSDAVYSVVNSPLPNTLCMRQTTGSSLAQVMACRLFGGKALLEPMLVYCQLDSCEQVSVKFKFEFYHFNKKMDLKMSSAKMATILSREMWVN